METVISFDRVDITLFVAYGQGNNLLVHRGRGWCAFYGPDLRKYLLKIKKRKWPVVLVMSRNTCDKS